MESVPDEEDCPPADLTPSFWAVIPSVAVSALPPELAASGLGSSEQMKQLRKEVRHGCLDLGFRR
jgi:hypothetical protein